MPRMREAIRSGWNTSSASTFSPVDANLIGLPVIALTRERRAAARVAVELREDDAVERDALVERLRDVDRFLAGHRVERRAGRSCGFASSRTRASSSISSSSICRRPAVSTITVSRPVGARALDPAARRLDRVLGIGPEDRHLDLLAELLELVDRGGALQVGGDEAGLAALLAQVRARAWRRSSSCPSPGGRRAG